MKVIKGIAFFFFFAILFGSCFDPPKFPVVPEILFKDIVYKKGSPPDIGLPTDTLILTIEFKDGDGDLGLDQTNPAHFVEPYNSVFYFQTDGSGGLRSIIPVPTEVEFKDGKQILTEDVDYLQLDPSQGDLAFSRTRNNPLYSTLPRLNCADYQFKKFLIKAADTFALHKFSDIDTSMVREDGILYHVVKDTLYQTSNPDHNNIEIDLFIKEGDTYKEYDFRKEYCTSLDGRFPVLSPTKSSLAGKLEYRMESIGFSSAFAGKTLKIRIQIKDRARNLSNVVEHSDFTLESIRR